MKLYGLAILPNEELRDMLVEWRTNLNELLLPPRLGTTENIPHCTILQCPFFYERLSYSLLTQIGSTFSSQSSFMTKLDNVYLQPKNWVFLSFLDIPELIELHRNALHIMDKDINRKVIDSSKNLKSYTAFEKKNYLKYGYRYVNESFAPHITLGKLDLNLFNAVPETIKAEFNSRFHDVDIEFNELAFYEAGDNGVLKNIIHRIPI